MCACEKTMGCLWSAMRCLPQRIRSLPLNRDRLQLDCYVITPFAFRVVVTLWCHKAWFELRAIGKQSLLPRKIIPLIVRQVGSCNWGRWPPVMPGELSHTMKVINSARVFIRWPTINDSLKRRLRARNYDRIAPDYQRHKPDASKVKQTLYILLQLWPAKKSFIKTRLLSTFLSFSQCIYALWGHNVM